VVVGICAAVVVEIVVDEAVAELVVVSLAVLHPANIPAESKTAVNIHIRFLVLFITPHAPYQVSQIYIRLCPESIT
jgi:hypothetical protein